MISHTTKRFRTAFQKLPKKIQVKAKKVYKIWKENPEYPSLWFKKVHSTKPIYSVRIDLDYRAIGIMTGDTVVWFWIGSHSDYNRLLKEI